MGAFVISPSPSRLKETLQTAGPPRSTGVTPLPRSYGPDRHPHAFGRFPGFAGYTTYLAPVISHPGREGFTIHSVCPCHRAVASTPPRWECRIGQISAPHAAFTLRLRARPSEPLTFEATSTFTVVTARRIAQPPKVTFVTRLQPSRLPSQ